MPKLSFVKIDTMDTFGDTIVHGASVDSLPMIDGRHTSSDPAATDNRKKKTMKKRGIANSRLAVKSSKDTGGPSKRRGVNSLLFDGDSSGQENEAGAVSSMPASTEDMYRKSANAKSQQVPKDCDAAFGINTGVPRADSSPVRYGSDSPTSMAQVVADVHSGSPRARLHDVHCGSPRARLQLEASDVRSNAQYLVPDTVGAIHEGITAMRGNFDFLRESLLAQYQLTQRVLSWQERFEAQNDEFVRSMLQKQEELQDAMQKAMSASSCPDEFPIERTDRDGTSKVSGIPGVKSRQSKEGKPYRGSPTASQLSLVQKKIVEQKPLHSALHKADHHHDPNEHCKFALAPEVKSFVEVGEEDEDLTRSSELTKSTMKSERESARTEVVCGCGNAFSNGDICPKCGANCAEARFGTGSSSLERREPHRLDTSESIVALKGHWQAHQSLHGHHSHHGTTLIEKIVEHKYFEYMSAGVIFSHSLFIGLYVEYLASWDPDGHVAFSIINFVLTAIFLFEVGLKFAAEKREFICGPERSWNIFDISLIFLVVVEFFLRIILAGKDKKRMKTVLKIAEMARTVRILRIFRCLKFSETLQVIIMKIFMSIRTLCWVLVLIAMMQGVIAVSFTQGANEYLAGAQHDTGHLMTKEQEQIHKHFGSVGKSMKTCFASISGGLMWEEVFEELGYISVLYALIFVSYIVAATFAMLNIVTGIFINDMQQAEKAIREEDMAIRLERYHEELEELFVHEAGHRDGHISLDEFMKVASNKVILEILGQLGMTQDEAGTLFHLLDEDNSGELGVDEFLAGCIHLMDGTTGLDMKVLLYESRRMRHKLADFIYNTEDTLMRIGKGIEGVDLLSSVPSKPKDAPKSFRPTSMVPSKPKSSDSKSKDARSTTFRNRSTTKESLYACRRTYNAQKSTYGDHSEDRCQD